VRLIHVVDTGYFNFSRLANAGVAQSSGEVVLLLNDDVEPIRTGWLHRMVDAVMRPDVGAVGARLVYPDRSIQHAGVAMGIGGVCGHLWRGLREQDAARCPYVVYPGERMAVTGACMAVRRDVFNRVGGFDEVSFPVSLNDIDFCLRVRSLGLRNIYRGDAVLIHYESQSRGPDTANFRTRRRLARETEAFLSRWRHILQDDPFGSPEFDMRTESGAVHYSALYNASYKLRDFSEAFRFSR
jgi:GT2 family glycosyltransferase